jgi:tripartite-type tricarboxylate transporter receptor subunit TctC
MTTAARFFVALCLLAACAQAGAQAWPARPIRFIVPFPPGGPTDTHSRWAAQHLNAAFGQPVVVENRAGAAGIIGTEAVARAAADGYTLLGSAAIRDPSASRPACASSSATTRRATSRRSRCSFATRAACAPIRASLPGT